MKRNYPYCNAIRELPVTLEDKKKQPRKTNSFKKMKKLVWLIERQKKGSRVSPYSICEQVPQYADRAVMPYTRQNKILGEFHIGYLGMTSMKSLMRSYTYWPRMDLDIEK